jgi:RraA family protein
MDTTDFSFQTADLCDIIIPSPPQRLQVVQPNLFQSYGKKKSFYGKIETIRCFESNPLVRQVLSEGPPPLSGGGSSSSSCCQELVNGTSRTSEQEEEERNDDDEDGDDEKNSCNNDKIEPAVPTVLVIDGGASQRCALLGDKLASLVKDCGWSGVVINGYIRDSRMINEMDVGIRALGTHPVKSCKDHMGERGISVCFGGVEFVPGHYLFADEDGILVCERDFSLDV